MAKTVKMADMSGEIAARVFAMLNPGVVNVVEGGYGVEIETDTEPKDLIYPEGWYYSKGCFTNKHYSTTGVYSTVVMLNTKRFVWDVPYCTV